MRPAGQHSQATEQLGICDLARVTPSDQHISRRWTLARLALSHDRPVEAKPCRQRLLTAETSSYPRPPQLST
jgi:hypothetical protein